MRLKLLEAYRSNLPHSATMKTTAEFHLSVGSTVVLAVTVNVVVNAPDVVRLPPRVMVLVPLFTPVPPFAPATVPLKFEAVRAVSAEPHIKAGNDPAEICSGERLVSPAPLPVNEAAAYITKRINLNITG